MESEHICLGGKVRKLFEPNKPKKICLDFDVFLIDDRMTISDCKIKLWKSVTNIWYMIGICISRIGLVYFYNVIHYRISRLKVIIHIALVLDME